jgi:tRNA 2-selenouridine synthase
MKALRTNTKDLIHLFLDDVPMMDVRAPVEYEQGAFPHAINLPLMSDDERQQVGTCYKQRGQQAAIELGHRLVCGSIKEQRISAWKAFAEAHPEGFLYCFRGGLRSKVTQQWLKEAGIDYPFVEGGYKAMRRFLIDTLAQESSARAFVILSGRTGTGKTKVIERTVQSIDLEGFANHRGSSFGRRVAPQPRQIDFENRLAIALLKQRRDTSGVLLIEDESRAIGCCHLPEALFHTMTRSPIVVVEEVMESRIETVIQDYVTDLLQEYQEAFGEEGFEQYADYMQASLQRVSKRLGGERYQVIQKQLTRALEAHRHQDDLSYHSIWIETLLSDYYDPMYDYQLDKKRDRVLFRGDRKEVFEWFSAQQGSLMASEERMVDHV